VFADEALAHAHWAVVVTSLDTGEVLYRVNGSKLMMPASNMKIVTLAAAAERLGWDFRYQTRLETRAPLRAGRLRGDLVVVGTGDPSLVLGEDPADSPLTSWARELRAAGIRRVDGRLVGDDDAFDDVGLGPGWAWDYLEAGYAAPIGALQLNDNAVRLSIAPGRTAGQAARLHVEPAGAAPILDNRVTTSADGDAEVRLAWRPGQRGLELTGVVPTGSTPLTRTVTVDNPTRAFVGALRARLAAERVAVLGPAVDIDDIKAAPPGRRAAVRASPPRVLLTHQSAPLAELARPLMKQSRNQYAESLLKALGATEGAGTVEAGRRIVRAVLESWGIAPTYVMADGSGLSRYNYVTADLLVAILKRLHDDERHREPFLATLPVAGVDGSLARRMQGTRAEGNARAKTGSIANVRSLSGYVTTADGERLAFSILANHFLTPSSRVTEVIDRTVVRLAEFTRRLQM
jgi:D-alanyl-D-alanine carboxypeptidase/D-alanyl-D-alanine-endopeptidase (penicillin-binding protein 4)